MKPLFNFLSKAIIDVGLLLVAGLNCLHAQDVFINREIARVALSDNPAADMRNLWTAGRYDEMDRIWARLESHERTFSPGMIEKCREIHISSLLARRRSEEALAAFDYFILQAKNDSLRYYDINSYMGMSDVFVDLGENTLATECLEKAGKLLPMLKFTSQEKAKTIECQYHLAKSKLFSCGRHYREASQELDKADRLAFTPALKLSFYGIRSRLLDDMGNHERAKLCRLKALALPVTNPNKAYIFEVCLNDELALNKPLEVFRMIERNPLLVKMIEGDVRMRRALLLIKAEAFEQLGHLEDANTCFKVATMIEDSLSTAETELHESFVAQRINPDKYESLRCDFDRSSHAWLATVVIIALVAVLLTMMLYRAVLLRSKARRETSVVRDVMEKKLQETIVPLHDELSALNQTLTVTSMENARMAAAIDSMRKQTSSQSRKPIEKIGEIKRLISESNAAAGAAKMFNLQFDKSNRELTAILAELHPSLTKSEMRMAGYIVLNLTDKEIADITNRSVRTVESVKYTLRKKLHITEPTSTYLVRLLAENRKSPR